MKQIRSDHTGGLAHSCHLWAHKNKKLTSRMKFKDTQAISLLIPSKSEEIGFVPIIPALKRLRQEDCECDILGH